MKENFKIKINEEKILKNLGENSKYWGQAQKNQHTCNRSPRIFFLLENKANTKSITQQNIPDTIFLRWKLHIEKVNFPIIVLYPFQPLCSVLQLTVFLESPEACFIFMPLCHFLDQSHA